MKKTFLYTSKVILTAFLIVTVFGFSVPTHKAQAGGALAGAKIEANTAASAISDKITAGATTNLLLKETVLDGIGWAIAKQMVSSMTKSLVNWINSGFQGSPAFITDLNSFLLDALDTAAGEYIKSLGGIGEFICSPFKLDVQAALQINYQQARSGMPSGPTGPACKLSDIKNNIEGFLSGIGDNGWQDWLSITSNPQNTPYGAYLEAEAKLNIKLKNEAGQEIQIADWGNGFLSKRVCEAIEGKPTGKGANCKITTPGQVISEALTFQLSTGPRSLIEADEINEVIGALINQLTLQAMQGINGLLGLGGNSSYTDTSFAGSNGKSYLDVATEEAVYINTTPFKKQMDDALLTETSYSNLVSTTMSEASTRLQLASAGQNALTHFFNDANSSASLLSINKSHNLNDARARLNSAYNGALTPARRAALDIAKAQLDTIANSINTIAAMSDATSTDFNTVSFTNLEIESTRITNTLTGLVAEMTPIIPTVASNIATLTSLISRFDNASSSASVSGTSTSAASVRQNIVFEFVDLVNKGVLTSPATVEIKRLEWQGKLRN